jgi:hypothetical protein
LKEPIDRLKKSYPQDEKGGCNMERHQEPTFDISETPLISSEPGAADFSQETEQAPEAEPFDGFRERAQQILYEWFVQYNPLYFFSALCVLGGMFLISIGLQEMDWTRGQLWLTGVMQCYEILVIAGAALMFRKAFRKRPSVILGLMAVTFLFDCTFRTEAATTLDQYNQLTAGIWLALVVVKVLLLLWVFHLKISRSALLIIVLLSTGIAVFPQVFQQYDDAKAPIHLLATWYGVGLLALARWKRPSITCRLAFDAWGETVLRRIIRAAWFLCFGWYFFHLVVWTSLFDIQITLTHVTPWLLLALWLVKQEGWIWVLSGISIAITEPATLCVIASIIGVTLIYKASALPQKRLYVGAVLAAYLSLWTYGWQQWPLPEVNLTISVVTAIVLIVIAWKLKLPFALLPLLAGVYPAVTGVQSLNFVEQGSLLLASGFLALLAGVAFNWSQRKLR